MYTDYDQGLENLVKTFTPHWTEMRVKKHVRFGVEKSPLIVSEVLFIGEPSLLCYVDCKTWHEGGRFDYFPIALEALAPADVPVDGYATYARLDGKSHMDSNLRWLFDGPSLRLIEAKEEAADGAGASSDFLRFYGGLELKDSSGQKALQIMSTQEVDFTIELRIID